MQAGAPPKQRLKAQTLSFQELPRLEDLFLTAFAGACASGCPEDGAGLKRLRGDLESIENEASKRVKLLALELAKLYDVVEDPPEIEAITDETLLHAWRDNTLSQLAEIDEHDKQLLAAASAQAAAAAARAAQAPLPRAPPSASKGSPAVPKARQSYGGGGGGMGGGQKRRMISWPVHQPFIYRDTMRIRFHVGGY